MNTDVKKTKVGIIFDMPECGGCRTCEIACSFHHRGDFSPLNSSLKILDKKDRKGFNVLIINKSSKNNPVCDGCIDIDTPLCVQFCNEKEKLQEMIEAAKVVKEKSEK
ncbi:MAG: hypothetical protein HQ569_03150 [Actinobacteria bacterium]|nr:hypothetical protein [Actinomycetota bacterium]